MSPKQLNEQIESLQFSNILLTTKPHILQHNLFCCIHFPNHKKGLDWTHVFPPSRQAIKTICLLNRQGPRKDLAVTPIQQLPARVPAAYVQILYHNTD